MKKFRRLSPCVTLLAGALLFSPLAFAQTKPKPKPKPKPAAKPAVQGAAPMKGQYGQPNVLYTVGKAEPLNYALKSIEYSLSPINVGGRVYSANGKQKLVNARFLVSNPSKGERTLWDGSQRITLVSTGGQNFDGGSIGVPNSNKPQNVSLKPGQRAEFFVPFVVNGDAVIDRIIVQHAPNEPVLRLRVANFIKKLPAFFAPDGVKTKETLTGATGVWYPGTFLSHRFDGWQKLETVDGNAADEGHEWVAARVSVKNVSGNTHGIYGGNIRGQLVDADGEIVEKNRLIRASSEADASPELKAGQEYAYRIVFMVPTNLEVKTLRLGDFVEGESRVYEFPYNP